ncbi:MAG TPA: hypothetical protein VK694_06280 [Verrucomicrobiae bacterium]|nr:hypothetical protein [Verrucomicrobiae bacterium]
MAGSEASQEPRLTNVEIRHQQQPEQFRDLLDAEQRLRVACEDEDPTLYLKDNFLVFMSAASQEARSADHDVRVHSYNTPHQLTYMQLLRSISEAGTDYVKGLSSTQQPTVYHSLFIDMQKQAERSQADTSKTHDLQRHLSLAALHMRVIHEHQSYAPVSRQEYRYTIEEQIITPLALQALTSGRPIHPNLVDAHDQPEALSVLVRAVARFTRSNELPNLV